MTTPTSRTTPPADFLLDDGHFGAQLLRLLGAAGLHTEGEPVSNAIVVSAMLDLAAVLQVAGIALRSMRGPYPDLRPILHVIELAQRIAEFVPMAARALDQANPPGPAPANDNHHREDSRN